MYIAEYLYFNAKSMLILLVIRSGRETRNGFSSAAMKYIEIFKKTYLILVFKFSFLQLRSSSIIMPFCVIIGVHKNYCNF